MRVTISKSKNSESFYITHSFINKDGKSTSKNIKKLGTLDELTKKLNTDREGVLAWAKEQARIETLKYKEENESVSLQLSQTKLIDKDVQRKFNCGYLFYEAILSKLRIDNICRNIRLRHKFDYSIEAILSDLVYARILQPSSKKSAFEFAHTLLEQPKYKIENVYRALSILAKESDYIQSELYRNSNFIHQRDTTVLYYDCTNYYFEIEQEDGMKKYGKSKENRPNPIVNMGLFMDSDGMPLAFDINPGSQNEQKTLKPLEEKVIRDFDCSEFIYCSDSGLGSKDNRMFNNFGGRKYVITQSLKKLKEEDRDIALSSLQYRKLGTNSFIDLRTLDESNQDVFESIYYKEIPITSYGIDETLIVTYSPKYKDYQRKIRQGQIDRAIKMIGNGEKIKKTRKNPNDPARFITKTTTTKDGEAAEIISYFLNEEEIKKEEMYDGFYAVITNLDKDVEEIININKRRWQIEECFRIMKTDFSARPVYVQREDRIKAHFLTCFISLLTYRLLEKKLDSKYTINQILKETRNMNLCLIDGTGYIPTYTRTELTDKLHEIFGFRTDTEVITKSKMRNIIKKLKE